MTNSCSICSNVQEKSLLIMENLFYDYDIDSKFDLKGSVRNRLVDPSNQNGEETVLLDENLIQSESNSIETILTNFFQKKHFFFFCSFQCLGPIRCTY